MWRALSWVLIVVALALLIVHFATDAGDGQEGAGWVTWTAAGLAFAATCLGYLHQRQAKAARSLDRER